MYFLMVYSVNLGTGMFPYTLRRASIATLSHDIALVCAFFFARFSYSIFFYFHQTHIYNHFIQWISFVLSIIPLFCARTAKLFLVSFGYKKYFNLVYVKLTTNEVTLPHSPPAIRRTLVCYLKRRARKILCLRHTILTNK